MQVESGDIQNGYRSMRYFYKESIKGSATPIGRRMTKLLRENGGETPLLRQIGSQIWQKKYKKLAGISLADS